MRTIEINVYKYEELTEDIKEKVLEKLYDLNVDHDWWDYTYDDAATIGLKIEGFDIYHSTIDGHLMYSPAKVKDLVKTYHGKGCETMVYVNSFDMRTNIDEHDFEYGMLHEYLSILRNEYEYLTSRECIEECIEANEYEFDEDGNII